MPHIENKISEEEIIEIVKNTIKEIGAQSAADMGKVMGPTIKKIGGKADGKIVQKIVLRELSS